MTRHRHFLLLLILLTGAVVFTGLGKLAVHRQQEIRVLLTARDMARGGSWLIPHFRGQPRLRKPPLAYWVTAAAFRAAGRTDSPTVGRIPAAVAGLLLIVTIYLFGAFSLGRPQAFLAASMAATSFIFVRHARLAETDIFLCLFSTLAAACLYLAVRGSRPLACWTAAGTATALAFLSKGPAALLPAAAAALFISTERSIRRRVRASHAALFLLITVSLSAAWYLAVLHAPGTGHAVENELHEMLAGSDHPGNWFYYFYHLPLALAPWSLFLPFGLFIAARTWRRHAAIRFVAIWWLVGFLALSIIRNKQEHYALLLLPSSTLLAAPALAAAFSAQPSSGRTWARAYVVLIAVLFTTVATACLLLPAFRELPGIVGLPLLIVILMATAAATAIAIHRRTAAAFALVLAGTVVAASLYALYLSPVLEPHSLIPEFADRARPRLTRVRTVYAAGSRIGALEFYLDRHLHDTTDPRTTWARLAPGDALIICGSRKHLPPLPSGVVPELKLRRGNFFCLLFRTPTPSARVRRDP